MPGKGETCAHPGFPAADLAAGDRHRAGRQPSTGPVRIEALLQCQRRRPEEPDLSGGEVQGYHDLAFSFVDNDYALQFVSYDARNNVIHSFRRDGTRYVWKMAYNAADQTIFATGQGDASVRTPLSLFGP
jgi:YD repeat-containing protein